MFCFKTKTTTEDAALPRHPRYKNTDSGIQIHLQLWPILPGSSLLSTVHTWIQNIMGFSIELLFIFLPAVLWLYWPVFNSTLERVEFQVGRGKTGDCQKQGNTKNAY